MSREAGIRYTVGPKGSAPRGWPVRGSSESPTRQARAGAACRTCGVHVEATVRPGVWLAPRAVSDSRAPRVAAEAT